MRCLAALFAPPSRELQHAVPRMRASGGGRIIFLSSLWGRLSGPMVSHYAASKHAIEAIVDAARREFGPWNIDLVQIEPGVVATDMVSLQAAAAEARSAGLVGEEARHHGPLYRNYAKLLPTAYAKSSSAQAVAERIGQIVEARRIKPRYAVGTDAHAMITLAALLLARWLVGLFRSQLPVVDKSR
ncbi:MAG: SDR family NAD(P)-dependent oxidoreductase [Hyphomicrobiales bacterium]|nr:MAG: SDR family NAD(P)-dependent oxidoreductase [Hyphomicrobiales bacterium]